MPLGPRNYDTVRALGAYDVLHGLPEVTILLDRPRPSRSEVLPSKKAIDSAHV